MLPLFIVEEIGRLKSERLCSALQTLDTFFQQQAERPIMPSVEFGESTCTPTTTTLTYHHALAALTDVQSVLDFLAAESAAISEAARTAVARVVMHAMLGDAQYRFLFTLLEASIASEDEHKPAETTMISRTRAAELVARTVDVIAWVVDAVCTPLMESLTQNGSLAPQRVLTRHQTDIWHALVAREEALLCLARVGLASTSDGACLWGAPVHSSAVRVLEALVQTCFALLRQLKDPTRMNIAGKRGEEVDDADDDELSLYRATAQLGCKLASDDTLQRVAAQLQMPVQVLDEVDGFTRKAHTFAYDVLRHGVLFTDGGTVARDTADGDLSPRSGVRVGWTLLDSTRRPQSPLELYICAVSFISCATAYRIAFRARADDLQDAIGIDVWKAYVSVLERALQEGETALTALTPTSPRPAEDSAMAEKESVEVALLTYLSPLATRVNCYTTTRDRFMTLPPTEENLVGSEPGTPCESPVSNTNNTSNTVGASTGKDVNRPLARVSLSNDACHQKTAGTVASSRRSIEFPSSPARGATPAAEDDFATDDASTPGSAICTAAAAAATTVATATSRAVQTAYRIDSAVEQRRRACGAEDSMRSSDVTVVGMADAETTSLYGESAGLVSLSRSVPIAIASAKATATLIGNCTTNDNGNGHAQQSASNPRSSFHQHHTHATIREAGATSTSSACKSPNYSSIARRCGNGGTVHGLSASSPQQHPLCKSAQSPANSAAPLRPSAVMEPLTLMTADGVGRMFCHGSSKSSCLQPDRPMRKSITGAAFVRPALPMRVVFPSHVLLTKEVLTSLATLTNPSTCAAASMTALVDANALEVMSELLEYPSCTLQAVVMSSLENCFAFWETIVSRCPDTLLSVTGVNTPHPSSETHSNTFTQQTTAGPLPFNEDAATAAAQLPSPLRALLHTFSAFLGWDGEGWATLHAAYMQRALRLLINVLDYLKRAAGMPAKVTCVRPAPKSPHASPTALLTPVVHFLLRNGVIAHIWRCLSMDATKVLGAMEASAAAATGGLKAGSGVTNSGRGAPSSTSSHAPPLVFDPASMYAYGCYLYGTPAPVSHALLSEAQCTAMKLLYTLARSLDWSAAKAHEVQTSPLPPLKPSGSAVDTPAPDMTTYHYFMEESFKHLPACANCLRRCTYTRSQSCPIVPDDHEALSRVLHVLRILFSAMEAGVRDSSNKSVTVAADVTALRRTWTQQIADSQVLDVLAHIGTAAELVKFELPRLCIFTLRSYLDHVYVLSSIPVFQITAPATMTKTTTARPTSTTTKGAAATVNTTSNAAATPATISKAWISLAAMQALVVVPPPPPTTPGVSTWGRGAVRESLLVILLARMQRRCAGQSATASVPQRLEVLALLIDVMVGLADSLPTSLADGVPGCFDAATTVEVVRVTQRVVTAVVDCHVWSGTAQELRYLDPSNTTPVKEALRFVCRVAQLVNGSLCALLCVQQQEQRNASATRATATAPGNSNDSLGKRTASVLLAESITVTFAFHIVTMDLPLALAGLVNGTRWQTCGKHTNSQTSTTTGGGSNASCSDRANVSTSPPSASCSAKSAPRAAGVVVTMKPPSPSLVPMRRHDRTEFDDDDRRETCSVAAGALVELLCAVRRVDALLGCPMPLSSAVLAAFPLSSSATAAAAAVEAAGVSGNAEVGRLNAAVNASSSLSSVLEDVHWAQGEPSHQLDVVVVQNSSADFAAVVTSRVYTEAVTALAESPPSHENTTATAVGTDAAGAAAAPTVQPAAASSNPTTSSPAASTTAEPETEDTRNWRQAEQQWRRRAPVLRTAVRDAMQALDLAVLDHYLDRYRRHQQMSGEANKGTPMCHDAESVCAESAIRILAAEKKRYLASV